MATIRTWKLVSDYGHQYQSESNPFYGYTVTQQYPTTVALWFLGVFNVFIISNNNNASRQHKCQPHGQMKSGT